MSGRLVSCVHDSLLPPHLKLLASVLAAYGRDDGSSIRPSLATIVRKTGRSERRVQAGLAALQRLGVLTIVRRHTAHRPTEYRLDLDQLAALTPPEPSWSQPPVNGQQMPLPLISTGSGKPLPFGKGGVFHNFHRLHMTFRKVTHDASDTRSVQEILSTSTKSRARGNARVR
jgi:hypothetical protein